MAQKIPSKRKVRPTCLNCANAIFDEIWGEYKCLSIKQTLKDPGTPNHCIYHKEGTPKTAASEEGEQ